MVALPRHFLIVLLIALQLIAPLVHAHIGNDGVIGGLHWQAVEKLRTFDHASSIQSAHHTITPGAIVELGSTIKSSPNNPDRTALCLWVYATIIPLIEPGPQRLQTVPPRAEHLEAPPPRAHSPRSPPFQA